MDKRGVSLPGACDRTVRVIGVMGCSAAGKSTFAHDLAMALHAPCFPISLDHFFNPAACDELGTFEDCRTLDLDTFGKSLSELVAIVKTQRKEMWHASVAARVPVLASYFRTSDTVTEQAEVADAHADVASADSSLCAHEAEDAVRRATGLLAPHDTQPPTSASSTVFIVCEGFLLFADCHLTSSLFDGMINVTTPNETACWRRFHRLPRRKQKPPTRPEGASAEATPTRRAAGVYERRIQQMWETRTETRRDSLCRDLAARLETSKGWARAHQLEADLTSCAAAVRALLSAAHFFPPGLDSDVSRDGDARFWDVDTGEPTARFVEVMLRDGTTACPDGAWLSAETWARVRHALAGDAAEAPSPALSLASTELSLRERGYAEFRYWFFYEVLYYHALYQPLQNAHVALSRQLKDSLFQATVENGTTTTRAQLTELAVETAAKIVHHFCGGTA